MTQTKAFGAILSSWRLPPLRYYRNRSIFAWKMALHKTWNIWSQPRRAAGENSELIKRIAALELDIRDRDAEIRQLRQEYHFQREQMAHCQAEAGIIALEGLARQLATPLAQLGAMRAVLDTGREVRLEDIFKMIEKFENTLIKSGVTRIGAVGAVTAFDSRLHHCLSGPELQENNPVVIRFSGYRHGETILLKAMVNYHPPSVGV